MTTPDWNEKQAVLRAFDPLLDAFRTTGSSGSGGGMLAGVTFDAVDASYPNATTEVYEFYTGGLSGTLVATITVIYTNASKQFIQSAVKT